jgi:hypothetical protein
VPGRSLGLTLSSLHAALRNIITLENPAATFIEVTTIRRMSANRQFDACINPAGYREQHQPRSAAKVEQARTGCTSGE